MSGVEVKIADDGEVLIKGPNIFQGYYKNEEATAETLEDGWLHTGDLGRLDEDGFLYITGRKKDIIITAGGKNITPANLENGLKQNRWISQAVVVGDRRPYLIALVTLDPEEAPALAQSLGLEDDSIEALRADERVQAEVQKVRRRGELARRSGGADQALRDPRPRPLPGDRRADPDAQGQAQRGAREVRGRDRGRLRPRPLSAGAPSYPERHGQQRSHRYGRPLRRAPARAPRRCATATTRRRSSERRRRFDDVLAAGLLARRGPAVPVAVRPPAARPGCGSARRSTT